MEQRLIDANALMELYEMGEELRDYAQVLSVPIPVIQQNIKDMPTVDAVEVVRCKECVHWYDQEEVCLKIYSDGAVSPYAWQFRKPEDFCSYGERRDSDG